MPGIETAFANHTHIDKIRVAKFVNQTINAKDPLITAHNGMMNTVLGILAKGNMNCAGNEVDPTKDLFTAPKAATVNTTDELHKTPRQPNELEDGVVQTEAEKRKAEELRRQQEEEERLRLEEEVRKREEEERKKEDNGIKNFGSRIKTFVKKLISEPDEDEQE